MTSRSVHCYKKWHCVTLVYNGLGLFWFSYKYDMGRLSWKMMVMFGKRQSVNILVKNLHLLCRETAMLCGFLSSTRQWVSCLCSIFVNCHQWENLAEQKDPGLLSPFASVSAQRACNPSPQPQSFHPVLVFCPPGLVVSHTSEPFLSVKFWVIQQKGVFIFGLVFIFGPVIVRLFQGDRWSQYSM